MAAPAVAVQHQGQGQFVEVVDDHQMLGDPDLANDGERAFGATYLVAVRGVHQYRQIELLGQLQLGSEKTILLRGDVVVTDFTHRHHAVFHQVARQNLQHLIGHRQVIGLLGVQADGAEVMDTEHAGAKALPAQQGVEVVDEAADAGPGLALPEGRLDHPGDAGGRHVLVVVSGAADHVDMRVEVLGHGESSSEKQGTVGHQFGETPPRGSRHCAGKRCCWPRPARR